jgi:hypothetical protein
MVVAEGQLKGSFKGFKDRETIFEFYGGRKWRQAEYRYHYYYAYMPRAKIVHESGRYNLYVEGISSPVEVRPA